MKDKIELVQVEDQHLHCDNEECGYEHFDKDIDYQDLSKWVDFPCPKCGQSLLTQEDLEATNQLTAYVNMINGFSEEELKTLSDSIPEEVKQQMKEHISQETGIPLDEIDKSENIFMSVKVHNGVKINFEDDNNR